MLLQFLCGDCAATALWVPPLPNPLPQFVFVLDLISQELLKMLWVRLATERIDHVLPVVRVSGVIEENEPEPESLALGFKPSRLFRILSTTFAAFLDCEIAL
jgi:hypothetical protein